MTEKQDSTATPPDELVSPEEHAEAFESIEPGRDVADDAVPDDVEIAARSADMSTPSMVHEKVFVLGPGVGNPPKNPYTEANGYDHEPNKAATRQYAIDAGMWPTDEVTFKSAKRHPDGVSWILTYSVPVIPAHVAEDGAQPPRVVSGDTVDEATNYLPAAAVDSHDDAESSKPTD